MTDQSDRQDEGRLLRDEQIIRQFFNDDADGNRARHALDRLMVAVHAPTRDGAEGSEISLLADEFAKDAKPLVFQVGSKERRWIERGLRMLSAPPNAPDAMRGRKTFSKIKALALNVKPEDREAIARALAITMHGDDVEWRGFLTKADTFIAALPVQSGAGEWDICPYCDSEMEKDACSACGRECVQLEGYACQAPHSSSETES